MKMVVAIDEQNAIAMESSMHLAQPALNTMSASVAASINACEGAIRAAFAIPHGETFLGQDREILSK